MRVGMGYDVHRLTEERELILGGVEIPWEKGLLGHSDADVLVTCGNGCASRSGSSWRYRKTLSGYRPGL